MVEAHVGKKRRKEVRQAIAMKKNLTSSALSIACILMAGIVLAAIVVLVTNAGMLQSNSVTTYAIPIGILVVILAFIAPQATKLRGRYDDYKAHLRRYNISKDDMSALKRDEL